MSDGFVNYESMVVLGYDGRGMAIVRRPLPDGEWSEPVVIESENPMGPPNTATTVPRPELRVYHRVPPL